jgi:hypothetical protein
VPRVCGGPDMGRAGTLISRAASSMAELRTFKFQGAFLSLLPNVKHLRPDSRPGIQKNAAEYQQFSAVITHRVHQARCYSGPKSRF